MVCVCVCVCVCVKGGNERVVTHHNQEDGSGDKLKVEEADANQSSLHHHDNNGDKDQPTSSSSCVSDQISCKCLSFAFCHSRCNEGTEC